MISATRAGVSSRSGHREDDTRDGCSIVRLKLPVLPESPRQQRGVTAEVSFGIGAKHHFSELPGENVFWNCRIFIV